MEYKADKTKVTKNFVVYVFAGGGTTYVPTADFKGEVPEVVKVTIEAVNE